MDGNRARARGLPGALTTTGQNGGGWDSGQLSPRTRLRDVPPEGLERLKVWP